MSTDSSWQVLLADLSLILFLSTAAALGAEQSAESTPVLYEATPVAQHRLRDGGPTLGEWLATQPKDPHLRLTLIIPFEPWFKGKALARAESLAREARRHDKFARIVIEPSESRSQPTAVLTYEGPRDTSNGPTSESENPESGTRLAE